MNQLPQFSEALMGAWGAKTLSDLRSKAKTQASGMLFEAIRGTSGGRIVLLICVTRKEVARASVGILTRAPMAIKPKQAAVGPWGKQHMFC